MQSSIDFRKVSSWLINFQFFYLTSTASKKAAVANGRAMQIPPDDCREATTEHRSTNTQQMP